MRFHMGVSFRLSSLKKFIIPFIIGVLAYFGFSYFNIATVQAQTNMDSSYTFTLEEINLENIQIFTDMNAKQFLRNTIDNFQTSNAQLLIFWKINNNTYTFYTAILNDVGYRNMGISGYGKNLSTFLQNYTTEIMEFYFTTSSLSSSSSTLYTNYISCLNDISLCPISADSTEQNSGVKYHSVVYGNTIIYRNSTNINDNSLSYDFGSLSSYGYIYYSSVNLVFVEYPVTDTIKTLNITANNNLHTITLGDTIPTYYDLFDSVSPEPEPVPDDENINVPFSRYVYWFGEHDSTNEILINIYILIFLFAFGFMFLKILNIIRGVKW